MNFPIPRFLPYVSSLVCWGAMFRFIAQGDPWWFVLAGAFSAAFLFIVGLLLDPPAIVRRLLGRG